MKSAAILVFSSNLAGRHGAGAALFARQNYGAKYGVGIGRTGNAYAIPTKDANLRALPLSKIKTYVESFITYANENPFLKFNVTRFGCGLAGYTDSDIAPLLRAHHKIAHLLKNGLICKQLTLGQPNIAPNILKTWLVKLTP